MKWFVAVLSVLLGLCTDAAISFQTLGDLDGGEFNSSANGISGDGSIVVGYGTDTEDTRAVLWDSVNGLVPLHIPDGGDALFSHANDISDDGSIIVGYGEPRTSGIFTEAIRWDQGQGPTWLGHLNTQGDPLVSSANAVSGDGSVVVGVSGHYQVQPWLSGLEAYRWDAGSGLVGLGNLGGNVHESSASDISEDGEVVVGYSVSPDGCEAFRWDELDGMIGLGDLTSSTNSYYMKTSYNNDNGAYENGSVYTTQPYDFLSTATGISSDGNIIVGEARSNSGREAFMWDSINGMIGLGDIDDIPSSVARDVSADGSVIVGQGKGQVAVIWTKENNYSPISLDDLLDANNISHPEFRYSIANAVSDDGTIIVGSVTYTNMDCEAFILNLAVPEPQYWNGYLYDNESGDINTGEWLGWINVDQAPYVWSYSMANWMYIEDSAVSDAGAWIYFIK